MNRRSFVSAIALGSGALLSRASATTAGALRFDTSEAETEQPKAAEANFFPGFQSRDVTTGGATIHLVVGGSGPPLLLLHGYPQTHVIWRKIAPQLVPEVHGRCS